ncbi:MAG: LD-carboxypeptidase [Planctomycetota bacterium]
MNPLRRRRTPRARSAAACAALLLACTATLAGCAKDPRVTDAGYHKPTKLRPGDTIAFVAPAAAVRMNHVAIAKQRLEERGYKVVFADDLGRRFGYLAGTDERRAEELQAALADPAVDAVFPVTGGFGVTRLLHRLDFDAFKDHPKVVIGFSDITALHLALHKKAKWVTFHSPNPQWGLGGDDGMQPDAEQYFWTFIENDLRQNEGVTAPVLVYAPLEAYPVRTVSPGDASGPLIGGNLTLIASTLGTPYEVDTKGKVLFLEDIDEAPYRIDRYFAQLRDAGKFDDCAAVVLGQFTDCEPEEGKESFTLDELFEQYFADLGKPVIANFPAGHVKTNLTLPLGVPARLDADADPPTLQLLESPTAPRASDPPHE